MAFRDSRFRSIQAMPSSNPLHPHPMDALGGHEASAAADASSSDGRVPGEALHGVAGHPRHAAPSLRHGHASPAAAGSGIAARTHAQASPEGGDMPSSKTGG